MAEMLMLNGSVEYFVFKHVLASCLTSNIWFNKKLELPHRCCAFGNCKTLAIKNQVNICEYFERKFHKGFNRSWNIYAVDEYGRSTYIMC